MSKENLLILSMFDKFTELKKLGFMDPDYCPKDGSIFEVIEAGSTGIHKCHYEGQWPDGD